MAELAGLIRWAITYAASGFWPFVVVVAWLVWLLCLAACAASFSPIRINYTRGDVDGD